MLRVLSRLVLPVLLAAGCVAAWFGAEWLGDVGVDQAASSEGAAELQTPLINVVRVADVAEVSQRTAMQNAALAALPEPDSPLSCAAIFLDGELLWSVNPDSALVPGFAQLAVTAHAALDQLGADHRFETRAMAQSLPDETGRLPGGLFIMGSGDPVLMSYNYARSFRPVQTTYTPVESLADAIVNAGVTQIDGSVVGVERRFDRARVVSGLPAEIVDSGLVGNTSGLQLDDGLAERPGANGGVAVLSDDPAGLAAARIDDLLEALEVRIGGIPRSDLPEETLPELVPVALVE